MSYNQATRDQLDGFRRKGDRTAYYEKLIALGDPYGTMALGVVKQSNIAGVVARRYAIAVSRRYCRPIDNAMWLRISNDLMDADFAARAVERNFEPGTPSLRWNVIRDYHVAVFGGYNYPPETWTAWIPLQIDGEAKGQSLWRRMVTEDFLTVAVQTVWLVTGRIAHVQGIRRELAQRVVPQLASRPPLATGLPPDRTIAACMAKLAPYQLARSAALDKERLAAFYLAVLAKDPRLYLDATAIMPISAWRARPALISPAY